MVGITELPHVRESRCLCYFIIIFILFELFPSFEFYLRKTSLCTLTVMVVLTAQAKLVVVIGMCSHCTVDVFDVYEGKSYT